MKYTKYTRGRERIQPVCVGGGSNVITKQTGPHERHTLLYYLVDGARKLAYSFH